MPTEDQRPSNPLVERLRVGCVCGDRASHAGPHRCVCCLAADEIERLQMLCQRPARTCDAVLAERDRLRAALERIANGKLSDINTPLGPLHAAGIALQWEIDAKICREALAGAADETSAAQIANEAIKPLLGKNETWQAFESGPKPWYCVRCGTTKVIPAENGFDALQK